MVRPTDQEIIATKRVMCYSEIPRGGSVPHQQNHMGKHQGQSGGKWGEGKAWERDLS